MPTLDRDPGNPSDTEAGTRVMQKLGEEHVMRRAKASVGAEALMRVKVKVASVTAYADNVRGIAWLDRRPCQPQ